MGPGLGLNYIPRAQRGAALGCAGRAVGARDTGLANDEGGLSHRGSRGRTGASLGHRAEAQEAQAAK